MMTWTAFAVFLNLVLVELPAHAVILRAGSATGAAGAVVQIAVSIDGEGEALSAVRHGLAFDHPNISLNRRGASADCSIALGIRAQLNVIATDGGGRIEASVVQVFASGPIRDGLLYGCGFRIDPRAPPGTYPLVFDSVRVTSAAGETIDDVTTIAGEITVDPGRPVLIGAGTVQAPAGESATVPVRLSTGGLAVAATRNTLSVDASRLTVRFSRGQPECFVNPRLGKLLSIFVLADHASLVAEIIAEPGADAMDDGELYRCTFDVSPTAPVEMAVVQVSEVAAFDPEGRELTNVAGTDGGVRITAVVSCPGDCDGSGTVTVNELVRSVSIALGAPGECAAADRDDSGTITVDELVRAVNTALHGC